MSEVPWSAKDEKNTLEDTDELMLYDPTALLDIDKNKRMKTSNVKLTLQPKPISVINARNQAELEASILGTDLIVPDGVTVAVVIDSATTFELNKPFQIGEDSVLELYGAVTQTELFYSGPGKMFVQGFRFIDCVISRFFNSGITNVLPNHINTGITIASFRSNTQSVVSVDEYSAILLYPGDSVLFFDPNSSQTSYVVEKSTKPLAGGIFYQTGPDIAIDTVTDNGSGKARFTTATPHGLVVGRLVVLSGFTSYNGTFIVSAVDTPVTGTTFDVEEIILGADESGSINQSSIDSTDVRVSAERNPGQQDSMTQAEGRLPFSISFDSIEDTFVPLEDSVPSIFDFIQDPATERFIVNTFTGVITYTGVSSLTAEIIFELTIAKSTGGTDTATISLFNGATQQTKTDQIISLVGTASQKVSYNGGLFTINPGDTFQLQINNESLAIITVSALKVLIQR